MTQQSKSVRKAIPFLAAGLTIIGLAANSFAADITWTGGTNGTATGFGTSGNWSPKTVPTSVDNAIFNGTVSGLAGKSLSGVANAGGTLTYGSITFDGAPAFSIGTNNNGFVLNGVNGIAIERTNATTASQVIYNSITLGATNLAFDINGTGSLTIRGGINQSTAGTVFSKTGNGTLILLGDQGTPTVNSFNYSGGTSITGGTLEVSNYAVLGTGNVEVGAGATLQLDAATTITDTAGLTIDAGGTNGLVNLNFDSSLSEVVSSLTLGGVTYTSGTFNAANFGSYFTGTGNIVVATPEPASLALMGLLTAGGLVRRRRR